MKERLRDGLHELFNDYKLRYGHTLQGTLESPGGKDHVKSELEKYLNEDVEEYRKKFDILKWWKVNTQRFPILSKMARDILAVPVSTVALEAAFSTGVVVFS
ncbi:UNVERIFIED_CONTAM: Zinc finger BED domain-containing protein DAYSLEEPER [Sesamum indicum]